MYFLITSVYLRNYIRNSNELIQSYAFYSISLGLYAYGSIHMQGFIQFIPLIIWINLILTHIIGLPRLFEEDEAGGMLDQWKISIQPFEIFILSKWSAHWILLVLPLLFLTPVLQFFLPHETGQVGRVMLSLAIGSLSIMAIGSVGAALITGQRAQTSVLLLILMPFYLPVLLFGITASGGASDEESVQALLYLVGMAALSLPIALFATARILKS